MPRRRHHPLMLGSSAHRLGYAELARPVSGWFVRADSVGVARGLRDMRNELYSRGVYINRCYDELNLTQPELIRGVPAPGS